MTTHQLEYKGVILDVTGTYDNGSFGTYENEPEPRAFELKDIYLNGTDVWELVDNDLDEIELLIIEKHYS